MDNITVWKIGFENGEYFWSDINPELLDLANGGDILEVKIMTRSEYEGLSEFQGFQLVEDNLDKLIKQSEGYFGSYIPKGYDGPVETLSGVGPRVNVKSESRGAP